MIEKTNLLITLLISFAVILTMRIIFQHITAYTIKKGKILIQSAYTAVNKQKTIQPFHRVHYIARRLNPNQFCGLPITILFFLAAIIVALMVALLSALLLSDSLATLDQTVNSFFAPFRSPLLVKLFVEVTSLGTIAVMGLTVFVSSALLWSFNRRQALLPFWTTFMGAEITTWIIKYAVDRSRPSFLDGITELNPSFPSGHATAATAVVGFIGYIIARDLPNFKQRYEASFWSAVLIGAICFSRIFLSLHYLSDVVAGFLTGCFWLLIGSVIFETKRAQQTRALA
ncbi:phosphatase PAP2 family protein [Pseudomonas sp. PS01299]|uniref:phosphatase PAP2 family protein n=1 Tax=Pseudomonas sp. PS01299 TaxID=2991435 RepID=UPI00249BCFCB|nr:phosphatase PAP2 family protein [Pseudomonas sp. PS01299]